MSSISHGIQGQKLLSKLFDFLCFVSSLSPCAFSKYLHTRLLSCFMLYFPDSASNVPPDLDLNRPSALKVSNPFVVLNEGMAETLGKPMFEKNIAPKR